jgi:hypothetical protein
MSSYSKQRTIAEQNTLRNTLRATNNIPTPRFTRAHPVAAGTSTIQRSTTKSRNRREPSRRGRHRRYIPSHLCFEESAGFPFSSFVNIAFPYSLPAGSRARWPACECENDNCQERLQRKQEHTIPST